MPVHDWTRVDPVIFHAFHTTWMAHLMKALNDGRLPVGYYAILESVGPRRQPIVFTRHLGLRHVSGHKRVAFIEIVSPANKDRRAHVYKFAEKVVDSLKSDVQVLLIDLLPAGPHDPQGMHGAVWAYFDRPPYVIPADGPLTLVSYAWNDDEPHAYVEPTALGQRLIDMPLFLNADRYINIPLESTYGAAYHAMPDFWRDVIEQKPGEAS